MITIKERIKMEEIMDKKEQEKMNAAKNKAEFNSITQKTSPENQNQRHNAKKEGLGPINRKR